MMLPSKEKLHQHFGLITNKYPMKAFILSLLIIRSSLDIFTQRRVVVGPFAINIASIVALILLSLALIIFFSGKKLQLPMIAKYLVVFISFLLVSIVICFINYPYGWAVSIREWVRLISIAALLMLAYNSFNKQKFINGYFKYIFLALLAPLSVGYIQIISNFGISGSRVSGTLPHPNQFALFLLLFIGLSVWKYLTTKKNRWIFILLLQLIPFIMTFSLAGFTMFFLVVALLLMKLRLKNKLVMLFILIVFGAAVSQSDYFFRRINRLKDFNIDRALSERESVGSLGWRINYWADLITLAKEKPVLGFGLDTYVFYGHYTETKGSLHPHNDYIKFLVETGLVGLVFYVFFIFGSSFQLYRTYSVLKQSEVKLLFYILFIMSVLIIIWSGFGNIIKATAFHYYYWATIGVAYQYKRIVEPK